ncbi:site-specific integrase [Shinella zoogloeoides]|uniref:site-specific integrase n=1 Tax=Shinella zoogloeoides TaxID=352475 RepID=UPI00299DC003|nr:site-specific integrase [Shinella zoogloeoides]WPE22623.1 hypothetical protein ShzoTeo12_38400 [Shinella zoogloeoides]
MTAIQHVFKRGSVYWWRRRLPNGIGARAWMRLELSLHTKEMELARRIAPEVALASDCLLPALKSKMISPEDAKRILIQVATKHSHYLDAITSGRDAQKSRRSETVSAWAIRLYAAQGENAAIGPIEERALYAAGLDNSMIDEVRNCLEFHRTSGFARPGRQKLEGILKQYNIPLVDGHFREAESIYMRGMAAALLNTERRWSGVREDDLALVQAALSAQVVLPTAIAATAPYARPVPEEFPLAAQTPAIACPVAWQPGGTTAAQPAATQEVEGDDTDGADLEEEMFDTEGRGLVELVTRAAGERLASGDWNNKTCKQHIALANLFVRFMGHDDPRRMRQSHIADFKSIFYKMPKHYGKSPKDFDCSVAEILKRAENLSADERGFSTSTINRHMTQMGNIVDVCKHAGYPFGHYEGVAGLRSKRKGDVRDERGRFSTDELSALFSLPIWNGSASESERLDNGETVFHDAAYWLPLMAVYNGARREENCGLLLSEIDDDGELPCFRIENNWIRKLKNPQSKRRTPIHAELVRLGFLEYVAALRSSGHKLLFPELRAANSATPMGDVFDDNWQKMRAAALSNAKEEGKVFHSLRHWCNNEMKQGDIRPEIRKDILGHSNDDVNEGRYTDPARLRVMAQALSVVPVPSAKLLPHPIRLIKQVVNHEKRLGRSKKSDS